MKKNFLILLLLLCLGLLGAYAPATAQQDVQFSQYIFNGLALNPGYAGYKEVTNVHLLYRNQWTGLTGAPKTLTASIDGVTENKEMGLGFQVIADQLGAETNLSAFASYAYRIRVDESSRLSLGLAAGLIQYTVDGTKLTLINPDASFAAVRESVINPDLNFGVFYASDQYFWGLSVTDLFSNFQSNRNKNVYLYRVRHYYAQAGALFDISDNLTIKPSILIKEDLKGPTNLDLNLFFLLGRQLWLGASYRTGVKFFKKSNLQTDLINADAISLMAEMNLDQHWRIGYSFDYSTNHLQSVNSGSHEISIGYRFLRSNAPMLTPRNL